MDFPYRPKRTDANHTEISGWLRDLGYTVKDNHMAGAGFPDTLVSYQNLILAPEIKDGTLTPSARCLNAKQRKFHRGWQAPPLVLTKHEDILRMHDSVVAFMKAIREAGISLDIRGSLDPIYDRELLL